MPTDPKDSFSLLSPKSLFRDLLVPKAKAPAKSDISVRVLTHAPNLEDVSSDLIRSTLDGLREGNSPCLAADGTGGVYLMPGASGCGPVSVFKPIDEEPKAVNNPRKNKYHDVMAEGEGLKKGTTVGEGANKEVAVYLLDHPIGGQRSITGEEKGFSGVPLTLSVTCYCHGFYHPDGVVKEKIGSLQKFVKNDGSCEDGFLFDEIPDDQEVHKIAVLDVRMANADRHVGNILKTKGEDGRLVLTPIDHGYCLPSCFEDCTFEWIIWPQAKKPFSRETVEYIMSLDAEKDIDLLNSTGYILPSECARTLRISTMLLKKGVKKGLTPFAIGNIMCREHYAEQSVIEEIVQEANALICSGSSEAEYMQAVSQIMDGRLAGFSNRHVPP